MFKQEPKLKTTLKSKKIYNPKDQQKCTKNPILYYNKYHCKIVKLWNEIFFTFISIFHLLKDILCSNWRPEGRRKITMVSRLPFSSNKEIHHQDYLTTYIQIKLDWHYFLFLQYLYHLKLSNPSPFYRFMEKPKSYIVVNECTLI